MKYESTMYIDQEEADFIEEALADGTLMGESESIINTAYFANGMQADIKCCGADDGYPAWTEAVLFDDHGREIYCSEPEDSYFGSWELEDNDDNLYIINVMMKGETTEAKEETPEKKITKGETMLTLGDLKTGMKVRTRNQGDYYVILDWTHKKADKLQCTGLLIRTSDNHETPWIFHGLLGYKSDLTFPSNKEWDIQHVYVYTGITLDEMEEDVNSQYWQEITEPVQYDQQMLAKYFAKFE